MPSERTKVYLDELEDRFENRDQFYKKLNEPCKKYTHYLDMKTIEEMMFNNMGICLHCGEITENIEPDATDYKCETCGCFTVYGIEEAIVNGSVVEKE